MDTLTKFVHEPATTYVAFGGTRGELGTPYVRTCTCGFKTLAKVTMAEATERLAAHVREA